MARRLELFQLLQRAPCIRVPLAWTKPPPVSAAVLRLVFCHCQEIPILAILGFSCSQVCKKACCFPNLSLIPELILCRSCGCWCFVFSHLHFGVGGEYLTKKSCCIYPWFLSFDKWLLCFYVGIREIKELCRYCHHCHIPRIFETILM